MLLSSIIMQHKFYLPYYFSLEVIISADISSFVMMLSKISDIIKMPCLN